MKHDTIYYEGIQWEPTGEFREPKAGDHWMPDSGIDGIRRKSVPNAMIVQGMWTNARIIMKPVHIHEFECKGCGESK